MDVLPVLEERALRRSDNYRLVTADALSEDQQKRVAGLESHPDFCGLLVPDDGEDTVKVVDHEGAALLSLLRRPRPLPASFQDAASCRNILGLILDDVLEIEIDEQFVSGRRAYDRLPVGAPPSSSNSGGQCQALSRQAIRYAVRLGVEQAGLLATRLYCYNRLPPATTSCRGLSTEREVRSFLGLGGDSSNVWADWEETNSIGGSDYWLVFQPRERTASGQASPTSGYKIYVSPRPDRLADVLHTVARTISPEAVYRFKVAGRPSGVLRPDKFVLYLRSADSLERTADNLVDILPEGTGHGVPFTADLADHGLLSWGVDPGGGDLEAEWKETGSWRTWITDCLARAIVDARRWGLDEPDEYALYRAHLEGVDTATWSPIDAGEIDSG